MQTAGFVNSRLALNGWTRQNVLNRGGENPASRCAVAQWAATEEKDDRGPGGMQSVAWIMAVHAAEPEVGEQSQLAFRRAMPLASCLRPDAVACAVRLVALAGIAGQALAGAVLAGQAALVPGGALRVGGAEDGGVRATGHAGGHAGRQAGGWAGGRAGIQAGRHPWGRSCFVSAARSSVRPALAACYSRTGRRRWRR